MLSIDAEPVVVRRRRDVAGMLAGVIVLLITGWFASADSVSGLEEDVFWFFNDWSDWVERPGWFVMQAGTLAAVVVGALVAQLSWRRARF